MGALGRLWSRYQASHLGRALRHYGLERGQVLAGGLAYVALFSLSAILVLLFAVFGGVLRANPDLLASLVTTINGYVPGLLGTGDGAGVDPEDLLGTSALSTTGSVSLVVALVAGTGWMAALREGVRAMFAVPPDRQGPVVQRLRDLVALLTIGAAVLGSAVLSITVNALAPQILGLVGLEGSLLSRAALYVLSVAVVFAADTVIFVVLLRVLSHLPIPARDLRSAALLGAALFGVLKILAGQGLGFLSSTSNPLLQSAGVVAGLLVWLNIVFRVVLTTAAWAATDPAVAAQLTATEGERVEGPAVGPAATLAAARAARAGATPSHSLRAGDRVLVTAGAVVGVAAAVGARAALDGARGLLGGLSAARRR